MKHLCFCDQLVTLRAGVRRPVGVEVIDKRVGYRAGVSILYLHVEKRKNIHKRWFAYSLFTCVSNPVQFTHTQALDYTSFS